MIYRRVVGDTKTGKYTDDGKKYDADRVATKAGREWKSGKGIACVN